MNKLGIIRTMLNKIVSDIDTGNSNIDDNDYEELLSQIYMVTQGDAKYSKYQAINHLKVSRATFDNYVRAGYIPQGRKQQGFTEKFWTKRDLDNAKVKLSNRKTQQ